MKKLIKTICLLIIIVSLAGCDFEDMNDDVNGNIQDEVSDEKRNIGTIDITLEYNSGIFEDGDTVEIDYEIDGAGDVENVYWQLSEDGTVGSNWNATVQCWFQCDNYVEFNDIPDGEYYLIVKVEAEDKVEILKSTGKFVFNTNPIFEVDIDVDTYTGRSTYTVDIDITNYNTGYAEELYWQVSTSMEYDDDNWSESTDCMLMCDYYITIKDLEEGMYYLHLKIVNSSFTQYYTVENQFEIKLSELQKCETMTSEYCVELNIEDFLRYKSNVLVESRTEDELKMLYIEFQYNPDPNDSLNDFAEEVYYLFVDINYDELAELGYYDVIITINSVFIDSYGNETTKMAIQFMNSVDELIQYNWVNVSQDVVLDWLSYKHPAVN